MMATWLLLRLYRCKWLQLHFRGCANTILLQNSTAVSFNFVLRSLLEILDGAQGLTLRHNQD